ncbi:PREDICTED: testis-specific Y-encoded-like protein 2 isoform X1 [Miniopterus natalensis]|uniref:testis-specific Y-encoded-like protein 2 isoform X1 n=1 Tax=Miniopterus natalensis TaxID=291302 RepID=UPI0007A6C02A|nr:PREDICTED: testis-specific Y-encoded-like protein 2 isoform X1 [Miniopterus natalensis]
MRGVGLGPSLPPPPPYVILEEGGVRAYFALGAGCSCWDPDFESGYGGAPPEFEPGYGGAPPPTESLETFSPEEVSGGSLEIDIQVPEPSGFDGEKALETCSIGGREYQMVAGLQGKEEAIIIVEDDEEEVKESVRKRRRRRKRRQRKVKKASKKMNPEKIEYVLQALENIQLDLEAVNIKAGKAFLRLKRKFIQMRRPFLERRDLIIQNIPGFWVKADLRHISMGYKMKLYFQTNPYFTNMVIVKEFQCNRSGRLVSHSTPIRWHRGQEPQAQRHRNQDTKQSFFTWFSNHSLPEADRIAEIIKNDLWVNPVRYYMMGESGYRANRKKLEKKERLSHNKKRDKYEVVIMDDFDDYQVMKDIIGETSDSDVISDNETIHDIKISDFMDTTDCFETTDNEITDISESLCDSESPDRSETTDSESADDNENPDYNSENTDGDDKNLKDGSYGNNLDSSDIDDGDETSDDEDDGNEGDNEGSDDDDSEYSDDDGNEGDNESSDDDDRDIDYYERDIEEPEKDQVNSNNLDDYEDEVENIFEEESSMEEEEEGSEEGGEDSDDEEGSEEEEGIEEDWEDSDMEEVLQVQNPWANPGKRGKTG